MVLAVFLQTSVLAQTYSKPSVPEFTVQYVERSYDVAPTYTFDPYTGQNVMTSHGHRATDRTIEITIENQPFTPITLPNGTTIKMYYDVRSKPHFSNTWNEIGAPLDNYSPFWMNWEASTSEFTTLIDHGVGGTDGLKSGDAIDFQVRARIGYIYVVKYLGFEDFCEVAAGDWSSTQTVTIGENAIIETPTAPANTTTSTLPPQTPTATPNSIINSGSLFNLNAEQTALIIAFAVIAVLATALVVIWRKRASKEIVQ
jgi:hypothetical protein